MEPQDSPWRSDAQPHIQKRSRISRIAFNYCNHNSKILNTKQVSGVLSVSQHQHFTAPQYLWFAEVCWQTGLDWPLSPIPRLLEPHSRRASSATPFGFLTIRIVPRSKWCDEREQSPTRKRHVSFIKSEKKTRPTDSFLWDLILVCFSEIFWLLLPHGRRLNLQHGEGSICNTQNGQILAQFATQRWLNLQHTKTYKQPFRFLGGDSGGGWG